MDLNKNNIKLGSLIASRVAKSGIDMQRICNFFKLPVKDIEKMYEAATIDTHLLLKWSKLLEYDFFRLYSQYLFFDQKGKVKHYDSIKSTLPQFKKRLYTQDTIDYILNFIITGKKTPTQIMDEFSIPKVTIYNWLRKHKKTD